MATWEQGPVLWEGRFLMGGQTWNKSPDKCLIKCSVVMGVRKRAGSGLGEQRGKEVSSGRGPPGKEARLPGQRRGGMGREIKLPGSKIPCRSLQPPLRARSPAGLLGAWLHIRCFLEQLSFHPSISPGVTWSCCNALGCCWKPQ